MGSDIIKRMENKESFLLANDGQYLGRLTLNKYDSNSIYNQYGNYGSKFSSTSIFNKFSNYGSKYSSLSPFNPYTNTPPYIYLRGIKYAFLSVNKFLGLKTIDPNRLIKFLEENNLRL